jgi:hypothetical protein
MAAMPAVVSRGSKLMERIDPLEAAGTWAGKMVVVAI